MSDKIDNKVDSNEGQIEVNFYDKVAKKLVNKEKKTGGVKVNFFGKNVNVTEEERKDLKALSTVDWERLRKEKCMQTLFKIAKSVRVALNEKDKG